MHGSAPLSDVATCSYGDFACVILNFEMSVSCARPSCKPTTVFSAPQTKSDGLELQFVSLKDSGGEF